MSYDETDTLYDEGMAYLYEQFEMQYENEFTYKKIEKFYENNREIAKTSLQHLSDARCLFEKKYHTAAFIHAVISIEVGIKSVVLRPILYSLTIDENAGHLLYEQTFKRKSLHEINKFYYDVLKKVTDLNFNSIKRDGYTSTILQEWQELQKLRNEVLHQGLSVQKEASENAINMASYVFCEIIPIVLDRFYSHIENGTIQDGSREIVLRREKLKNNSK